MRPAAGAFCVLVMVLWTGTALVAYADPARRRPWFLGLDLLVTLGLLVASPIVKGESFNATVPGFWVMCALLAWAVRYHWQGGLLASVLVAGTDLLVRDEINQTNYGNTFLLLIAGPIVGFMCESLQMMAKERDKAQRAALAEAERARLARAVHDGVLQVLALVQRRGAELGGEAADLGRLAGEQEQVLRTLIRSQDAVSSSSESAHAVGDLAAALGELGARPHVSVATPGTVVELPAAVVRELVSVVAACLDNVVVHVGAAASAWVLLEAFPDRVEISVRDEGPGIPAGRLEAAAAEGRLGVSESICGRVTDLGGTAELSTGPFGTEWELVVPLEAL
ncbi:histidine kinase [Nocardioides psychrotolerans]|uniref:Signal transduction histidine kinase n=1 Tax=Nocardioides psychrotolerans TaxID=1005945 RepID=A0A1I3D876_9ACTN|nr:histidine kinase [Nocardioides psychrotolerans]SFH82778.1 Signal transduction histidine kinase [Nocardioides psychrotolerans]